MDLLVPYRTLQDGGYVVVRELGRGGQGVMYLGKKCLGSTERGTRDAERGTRSKLERVRGAVCGVRCAAWSGKCAELCGGPMSCAQSERATSRVQKKWRRIETKKLHLQACRVKT